MTVCAVTRQSSPRFVQEFLLRVETRDGCGTKKRDTRRTTCMNANPTDRLGVIDQSSEKGELSQFKLEIIDR